MIFNLKKHNMADYEINVGEVEDYQMTRNMIQLEQIFTRAKSTVVQGGTVILLRKYADGRSEKFDELTSEGDLEAYREKVYKYL
jgi:hypothetical protein